MRNLLIFIGAFLSLQATGNTWIQKANLPGAGRGDAVSFVIGTKAYFVTGSIPGGLTNELWEWNQATNSWSQKANFPGASRMSAAGFSISGQGYIGTGIDSIGVFHQDFWMWDQLSNTWTAKNNFPGAGRMLAGGFSIAGKGYFAGGTGTNQNIDDIWEYQPVIEQWTLIGGLAGGARHNSMFLPNGNKVYMGVGYTNNFGTADFWEWDPVSNVWSQKAFFPAGPCIGASGFSFGDCVYIGTGGLGGFGHAFYRYSILTNTWQQPPSAAIPAAPRGFACGFSIGCKGYLALGFNHQNWSSYKNDLWEFTDSTNCVVGVNEITRDCNLTVSPNPVRTSATIKVNCNQQLSLIEMYDADGRKVRELIPHESTITFQRNDLAAGIYFFKFSTDEKQILTQKVIIAD